MAKKGYKHKTIAFKLDDPEDMKLYDELQKEAYGDFSKVTKDMWRDRLIALRIKPLSDEVMKASEEFKRKAWERD